MDQAPGPVYAFVDDTEKDPDPSTFETADPSLLTSELRDRARRSSAGEEFSEFPPRFADEIASTELPDELELTGEFQIYPYSKKSSTDSC